MTQIDVPCLLADLGRLIQEPVLPQLNVTLNAGVAGNTATARFDFDDTFFLSSPPDDYNRKVAAMEFQVMCGSQRRPQPSTYLGIISIITVYRLQRSPALMKLLNHLVAN